MIRKLRCCVIDDEPLALDLIKKYIDQTSPLTFVGAFTSASEAIQTLLGSDVDIVFLDIEMSELSGIELATVIPPHTRIIYITAYQQYAYEGFKANALDYLLKPVSYTEFLASVNKAIRWFEREEKYQQQLNAENDPKYIFVKSEYKLVQIPTESILYIEGLKDYVKIFLENSQTPIMSLMSMKALETYLPSSRFIRVHRSFIVQTSKIRVVERNRIVFGKQYIPISETYKESFNEYVSKHLLTYNKIKYD